MKITYGTIFLILILTVPSAMSQMKPAISVGAHYWYGMLDYSTASHGDIDVDVDAAHVYGPYINIGLGRFTLGGALYMGTFGLDYGRNGVYVDDEENEYRMVPDGEHLTLDRKRTDLNLSLGARVLPRINLFVAIKSLSYREDDSRQVQDGDVSDAEYDLEQTCFLYGCGFQGIVILPRLPVFLYYSFAYLFGSMKYREELAIDNDTVYLLDDDYGTNVKSGAVGIGYRFRPGLSMTAGYRAEIMETKDLDLDEKIHGLVITVGYTFR
jgi:hypothetical protein